MSPGQVSDELGKPPAPAVDPGRIRSQAQHPATAGTAPKQRVVDLDRGHEQILPALKHVLSYPRTTVRAVPGVKPGETIYVAKVWVAPGRPARVNARSVTKSTGSRSEVFWWAQRATEHFRDITEFHRTGELGRPHRRWAPQW
ncbi:hypothetical protein [Glutamicibacter protophormiae]|uniref:Uncharacterized protein n=1 Tax=Glutamicibacter protophormiae TaxID=37930 RepID=A0ABS4XQV1_GLUPR|nr:hypothetical protein [Glutamicibacter protophormiae]MBP2398879.1 hypothetical protein [Glutamicibacter protophormiae]GGL83280.1 hypothetical protein GCM10010038_11460 [Glutamicibacter protophormiae]